MSCRVAMRSIRDVSTSGCKLGEIIARLVGQRYVSLRSGFNGDFF